MNLPNGKECGAQPWLALTFYTDAAGASYSLGNECFTITQTEESHALEAWI